MRRGFTLLELIVVIIIIGILATIGATQYTKLVERGRTAEAKTVLGQLRTAEQAYFQEYGNFTTTLANLAVNAPGPAAGNCASTHYFWYNVADTTGTATRCAASGKNPQAGAYTVTVLWDNGTWGGTAGYY